MPVHDWTRVDAGIFHHFHHAWIEEISRALNRGLLPPEYYALAEQIAGPFGPDVLALRVPEVRGGPRARPGNGNPQPGGGTALADAPPRVRFHVEAEADRYAGKAKSVAIHHRSDHAVVALVEIVSPGTKGSRRTMDAFVRKAEDAMAAGIHLLVIDVLPPGPRDPQGIHPAIWQDRNDHGFTPPPDQPLTCAAYRSAQRPEAFIEAFALGEALPEMPLFLTPDVYVTVPLDPTYRSAWEAVPAIWRETLEAPQAPNL